MSNDAGFVRTIILVKEAIAPKTDELTACLRAIAIDRTTRRGVPAVQMTAGLVLVLL
jgi:hypothetical protein